MFEEKTFENILSDMLSYVAERNADLDTREGSIIYTALAPIALELETAYREMDMILEETFLDTASIEYLIKHGNQMGVELIEATFGHFKGEFDVDLEVGTRFNLGKFNYNVIEKLSDPTETNPRYVFELVCETSGSEPNGYLGDLTPITYVANLSHAKLTEVLIYGEEEEETEAYRYRLQLHVKNPMATGNVHQYSEWLDTYDGVGKYKVLSCWNGTNTIKLLILNTENRRASDELISEVQDYFDPPTDTLNDDITNATYPQGRGMGNGQASIGAIVTVDSVKELPVIVSCSLRLKNGYSGPIGVQEAVENYLTSNALTSNTIAYMPISAAIYNCDCVEDIVSLRVTVGNVVMDTDVSPFVSSITIADDEVGVLDADNCVWSA